jgi:hypothetical protein
LLKQCDYGLNNHECYCRQNTSGEKETKTHGKESRSSRKRWKAMLRVTDSVSIIKPWLGPVYHSGATIVVSGTLGTVSHCSDNKRMFKLVN